MSSIQVSAIIPTYNRREWVKQAIDSVLAQRGVTVECIVVDDGSSDGTGDLLRQKYGDTIHFIYQENAGESVARNHGAASALGEYLAFLDSDDLWMPDKLARQFAYMQAQPDCGAVYCQAYAMDEQGKAIITMPYGAHIPAKSLELTYALRNSVASGSTMLIRARVFHAIGGFHPVIRHGEDVEIIQRLLLRGIRVDLYRKPLVWIRSHTRSQSLALQQERFEAAYQDHQSMLDAVAAQCADEKIQQAVRLVRQKEAMRLLVFAIYARPDLVETYERNPLILNPPSAFAYDSQIQYFTPLLYRESSDPHHVLEFIHRVFAHRDQHTSVPDRRRHDALILLRAAIWCAGQNPRHAGFAWRQAISSLAAWPRLLVSLTYWRLIAHLVFGRLAIRLYLLWSRLS